MASYFNYYNPFTEVFDTKQFPPATILRTSFLEKMEHCFYLMAGKWRPGNGYRHLGLFDYITLMIPTLILECFLKYVGEGSLTRLSPLENVILAVFIMPLLLIRVLFGAACTILSSPFVALIHIAIELTYNPSQLWKEALNFEVETFSEEKMPLRKHCSRDSYEHIHEYVEELEDNQYLALHHNNEMDTWGNGPNKENHRESLFINLNLSTMSESQKYSFFALKRLNIGHIQSYLDEEVKSVPAVNSKCLLK